MSFLFLTTLRFSTALQACNHRTRRQVKRGTLDGLRGIPLVTSQKERKEIFLYLASGAGRFLSSWFLLFDFLLYLKLGFLRFKALRGMEKAEKGCGVIAREALPHSRLSPLPILAHCRFGFAVTHSTVLRLSQAQACLASTLSLALVYLHCFADFYLYLYLPYLWTACSRHVRPFTYRCWWTLL